MSAFAFLDGEMTGETPTCGNNATKGHSKNLIIIEKVPKGGRPVLGDSGAAYFDGHAESKDWLKDTTTLGGENTLLTEAEEASHCYFVASSVVAAVKLDEKRGETFRVPAESKLGV